MPKMKKDIMKTKRKEDDRDEESRPKKDGKDKNKIKIKKRNGESQLAKMAALKNGKKKLKKELSKNKFRLDRKDKIMSKTQKAPHEPHARPNTSKKDENVLFPCGSCGKEVNDNDEAIMCEAGCSYWYHRICTGMGNDAYALLTNEDHAEWVCDECIASKTVPLVRIH
eukprot:gene9906-10919_t